eukprot:TRINITY_DN1808_c0_g1_i2.p1 TRINITY_DN1808_c0_g1~~TRINITY_DN1808_c0_g1_i2.p1  ORF type:complete len:386 (+),score=48.63 TRINITY_DN1808_c0_g1_i2:359-1516(+)
MYHIASLSHTKSAVKKVERVFLMTYATVFSTRAVVQELILRYLLTPIAPENLSQSLKEEWQLAVRLRVLQLLQLWAGEFYHPDLEKPQVRDLLDQFFAQSTAMHPLHTPHCEKIRHRLKSKGKPLVSIDLDNAPEPIVHEDEFVKVKFKFELADSLEVARQLALIDSELFSKLQPFELFDLAWTRPNKLERAPTICALTQQFNRLSQFVVNEVLSVKDLNKRIGTVRTFVVIAMHCAELCNYNSAFAISSGLNNASIYRLKKTWEGVGPECRAVHEDVSRLLDEPNFATYRARAAKSTGPFVPYLGVHLSDVTFLDSGNKKYLDDEKTIANYYLMERMFDHVTRLLHYAKTQYCLRRVPQIRELFLRDISISDEEAYSISKQLEP